MLDAVCVPQFPLLFWVTTFILKWRSSAFTKWTEYDFYVLVRWNECSCSHCGAWNRVRKRYTRALRWRCVSTAWWCWSDSSHTEFLFAYWWPTEREIAHSRKSIDRTYTSVQRFGEINTFIQQGHLNWPKVTAKTFIMLHNVNIFEIYAVLLNFLFIKESKCITFSTQNIPQRNCFQHISILEWFQQGHVTPKTRKMLKIQLHITGIHYSLKWFSNKLQLF